VNHKSRWGPGKLPGRASLPTGAGIACPYQKIHPRNLSLIRRRHSLIHCETSLFQVLGNLQKNPMSMCYSALTALKFIAKNSKIPCIFPVYQGKFTETGSHRTAPTAITLRKLGL
jgi:hypothetical protein